MKNNNNQFAFGEGERTSFFKLFADNNFRIVIPMLQREYAQGRESAREVRTEFLKALYSYLDEGIPGRDLDFIYGNISGNDFKEPRLKSFGTRMKSLSLIPAYFIESPCTT